MTKVVFLKSGGVFCGFEEHGHSGYGEEGNDILCAALSSMTMLIINAIEVAYASDIEYTVDEETTDIKVLCKGALEKFEKDEKKRFAVAGIITAYYYQLNDLMEEYYDFLDVEEREIEL